MLRLISFLVFCVTLVSVVRADDMVLLNVGTGAGNGGGTSYTGPGDIVTGATAWYGVRAYNAAYAATGTGKAVNIRRASDNSAMDIVILTNGKLDVTTASTFCASTTCYVTEWYDQTGNGKNATQTTAGNQPTLAFSGCNFTITTACVVFNGTTSYLLTSFTQNQPNTVYVSLYSSIATSNTQEYYRSTGGNNVLFRTTPGIGSASIYADATPEIGIGLYTINVPYFSAGVFNGVQSVPYFNTLIGATSNSFGSDSFINGAIGTTSGSTEFLAGGMAEFGIWPSALTSTNVGSLCHNAYINNGSGTSC